MLPTTDGAWRLAPSADTAQRWYLPYALVASTFIGLALAVLLIIRRAAGAMTAPLPPRPLAATAIGLIIWAVALHLLWPRKHSGSMSTTAGELRSPHAIITRWLPLLTLLLFAIACSFPGARMIDWLVWPAAIAAIVYLWKLPIPARRDSPAIERDIDSEHILQQLTRVRTADGQEAIHGTLVAEFSAGERTTTLYVAFCPPFETLPQIEAHADEPLATVKVAQCLHNGAQLDVSLPEPAEEPLPISIEFSACGLT